jgi:hypothetical protein
VVHDVPNDLLEKLLEQLLETPDDAPIAAQLEEPVFEDALAGVARILPELLEGRSVSTYESVHGPLSFDLMGIGLDQAVPRGFVACPMQRSASSRPSVVPVILGADSGMVQSVEVARRAAMGAEQRAFDRQVFVTILEALVALDSGHFSAPAIMRAVTVPDGARLVLEHRNGQNVAVDGLVSADAGAITALKVAVPCLNTTTRRQIAAAVVTRLAADKRRSLSTVMEAIEQVSAVLAQDVVAQLMQQPHLDSSQLRTLTPLQSMACLHFAASQPAGLEVVLDLLAQSRLRGFIVSDPRLPIEWRSKALADALGESTLPMRAILDLMDADPLLTSNVARVIGSARGCWPLVRVRTDEGARCRTLLQLAGGLGPEEAIALTLETLPFLTVPARNRLVCCLPEASRLATKSSQWDRLLAETLSSDVMNRLDAGCPDLLPDPPLRLLAENGNGPLVRRWAKLMSLATSWSITFDEMLVDCHGLIDSLADLPSGPLPPTYVSVDRLLYLAETEQQVLTLLYSSVPSDDCLLNDVLRLLLQRTPRRVQYSPRFERSLGLLIRVSFLLLARDKLSIQWRRARLPKLLDLRLEEAFAFAVGSLSDAELKQCDDYIKTHAPRVKRFWDVIAGTQLRRAARLEASDQANRRARNEGSVASRVRSRKRKRM